MQEQVRTTPRIDRLKSVLPLVVLFLAVPTVCSSQSADGRQSAQLGRDEAAVIAVIRGWDDARVARDSAAFAGPLADELTAISPSGTLMTRAQVVAGATAPSGAGTLERVVRDEIRVRSYGNTAVVTSRAVFHGRGPDGRASAEGRRATQVLVRRKEGWRIVAIQSAPLVEPHALHGPAAGSDPDPRLVATCDPVSSAPPASARGCFIVAQGALPSMPERSIYWQIRRFDRRHHAEAARGPGDLVAEAEGSAWLFRFGAKRDSAGPGEHVADAGPFQLPAAGRHHVMVLYAPLLPGAYTGVHRHPGPEVFHVLSGEQCLETPAGAHVVRAGQSLVAPAGVPMKLSITGSEVRRAFAVVVHDAAQPWVSPADVWQPRGLCR